MTFEEFAWLYEAAKLMNSVIEIGSWKGGSTKALLSGCKGQVIAIDHFKGAATEPIQVKWAKEEDIYKTFMRNVGHFKNLRVLKMSSKEAVKVAEKENLVADMVFIDADHTYEGAKYDIEHWAPRARKLICGHDYTNWEGVKQAVDEKFKNINIYQSIWFKWL